MFRSGIDEDSRDAIVNEIMITVDTEDVDPIISISLNSSMRADSLEDLRNVFGNIRCGVVSLEVAIAVTVEPLGKGHIRTSMHSSWILISVNAFAFCKKIKERLLWYTCSAGEDPGF